MRQVRIWNAAFLCMLCICLAEAAMAQKGRRAMTNGMPCGPSALERTLCMIKVALDDVAATYKQTGGGGVTAIRMVSTNTFAVSISQEERVDQITYAFSVKPDGAVVVANRTEGTERP